MNIILLSGGSGKRLWPLSNEVRSKQFIKIFKTENGYESMVQRIYRQIKTVDPNALITIATSKTQVTSICDQLGRNVSISVEPCRRDTFAAIALATAYLHDVKGMDCNEAVVVCPVDPYVEDSYFECLGRLYSKAREGSSNLVLMGIRPTCPSENYGYIKPSADGGYSFTEKPVKEIATEYIKKGALWNGGVFAFRLSYVLDKAHSILGSSKYLDLLSNYDKLRSISFDYAVVEQETSIEVVEYSGTWKDLGTWNTLTEAMEEDVVGNVTLSDSCLDVHVINELSIPILVMGLKNTIVAVSPKGILLSDKEQSSNIKSYVDNIVCGQAIKAEKPWGSYRVIDVDDKSLTTRVSLNSGYKIEYLCNDRCDEKWLIVKGFGMEVLDNLKRPVSCGDEITMAAGSKHTVVAGEDGLQFITVQLGEEISYNENRILGMPV